MSTHLSKKVHTKIHQKVDGSGEAKDVRLVNKI